MQMSCTLPLTSVLKSLPTLCSVELSLDFSLAHSIAINKILNKAVYCHRAYLTYMQSTS